MRLEDGAVHVSFLEPDMKAEGRRGDAGPERSTALGGRTVRVAAPRGSRALRKPKGPAGAS